MIIARDESHIARAKILALHGMSKDAWHRFGDSGYKHYQVVECGFKYNMMDLQAAIGIHQLAQVEAHWLRRKEIWEKYNNMLPELLLKLPAPVQDGTRHAYHLYTIMVDENRTGISRDNFLESMNRNGIGTGVHYLSVASHPYYRERFGWRAEDWPHAMHIGQQTVSLPLSPKLTNEEVERVLDAVTTTLSSAPGNRVT